MSAASPLAQGERIEMRGLEHADFCPENLTLPSLWKGEAAYCDLAPHKAHS